MKIRHVKFNTLFISVLCIFSVAPHQVLSAQEDPIAQKVSLSSVRETVFSRPSNTRLNDIPSPAYRHFVKNYQQAGETSWSRIYSGYQAWFLHKGIVTQVVYTEKGAFQHAIRYLDPEQVDATLIKRVGKAFPGYQLDIISEINNECRTVFLITMKNQYAMKSVLLREGEFHPIDDLDYAGL